MRCSPRQAAPMAECGAKPPLAHSWLRTFHGGPRLVVLLRAATGARAVAGCALHGPRSLSAAGARLPDRPCCVEPCSCGSCGLSWCYGWHSSCAWWFASSPASFALPLPLPLLWFGSLVVSPRAEQASGSGADRYRALACYMSTLDATCAQIEIGADRSVDCLPSVSPLVSRPGLLPRRKLAVHARRARTDNG